MSDFMQQPLAAAAQLAPPWLAPVLEQGRERWRGSTLPTRKTEDWKYNNLQALQQRFVAVDRNAAPKLGQLDYPDLPGSTLVFADGLYRAELSRLALPAGARLLRFAEADANTAVAIAERLGSAVQAGRHHFAALNDATLA
ncbi:MAG: Fe-S cluster assembly protein SufD, partial [Parahaliea sp.]